MRVADPLWTDPLDPSFAAATGGRWNPPGSFPVLYLNADPGTARLQIGRLVQDQPFTADDLDDDAVWKAGLPLGQWRDATDWSDIGLSEQPDP